LIGRFTAIRRSKVIDAISGFFISFAVVVYAYSPLTAGRQMTVGLYCIRERIRHLILQSRLIYVVFSPELSDSHASDRLLFDLLF
jgi:hypothetical protein